MSWRDEATCEGHPRPDVWLNERYASIAVRLCNGCPSLAACREWVEGIERSGLAVHGVVAGLRMEQRVKVPGRRLQPRQKAMERRRNGAACVVCGAYLPDSGHGVIPRYCPEPALCRWKARRARQRLERTTAA